jgi:hypothetical protein
VARTRDLRKIRDTFVATLDTGEQVWVEAAGTARRKTVAEDIFLRMVVSWEEFISEWFIGAVSHDATKFKATMEARLARWQADTLKGSSYERYSVAFRAPILAIGKNPTVDTVRELVDPGEGNIEFRSCEDLLRRSADLLVPTYTGRVGAVDGAGGGEIIDAALAIRNVLAHRSIRAVRTVNERVTAFPSYPRAAQEDHVEGRHRYIPLRGDRAGRASATGRLQDRARTDRCTACAVGAALVPIYT